MKKQKIIVVGSGAIGSYFGGRLSQTGHDVSLLCRSDYEIVQNNGVNVTSYLGDFHYHPQQVIQKMADYQGEADYILIATKHLKEINYKELLGPAVHPNTKLVLIQNGVEVEAPLVEAFPENEIIGGIAFIGVSRVEYGIIVHHIAGSLTIGSYPEGTSDAASLLVHAFQEAGVECRATEKIQRDRWKKLIWNVGYNPTSVLAQGADTHQLMASEEGLLLVQNLMKEVISLGNHLGYSLSMDLVEKNIKNTQKMKPYKTSMCLDFEAGRPMEIDAILGNAVRKAREVNFPVPYMHSLYALLQHYM